MLFSEDTLADFFEKQVERLPDHEFLIYPDRNLRFTYSEFNERANNLAKGLLSIGVGKGDHVGIWAKNVPEWLTFMFATAKVGAVLVTVNTAYKSQRGKLNSEKFPFLKHVIHVGQDKHRGMYNTNELLLLGQNQDDVILKEIKKEFDNNDVVNMQYTSGTEGFPKGVMLTSRNILNDGYYIGENMNFSEEDRLCIQVPLFHCFGSVLGVMAVITHGSTIVMLEEFDPLLALSAIQKEKCTAIHGVPTMFIAKLTHPMFDMFDMSSLRTGIMAGSTCPVETMKEVIDKMNMTEITSVYGLTEASPGMTQTNAADTFEKKVNTVGTPFPNVEVKLIDPDTGEDINRSR